MSYNNGWNDNRSNFTAIERNGKWQIKGSYWHNNIEFRFAINEQSAISAYPFRGHINIIAPDGKIMQMQGVQRRTRLKHMDEQHAQYIRDNPKTRHEELNARQSVSLKSIDETTVKDCISKKAQQLYGTHISTITQKLRESTAATTFALAVQLYSQAFINKAIGKIAQKTQRAYINDLVLIGANLDERQMSELRVIDVKRLHQQLKRNNTKARSGSTAKRKLNLAARFWQFCREEGLFRAAGNPFTEYISAAISDKKGTAKLQRDAVTSRVLPEKAERKINELIESNIADGRYIGIAIIKDAHISSADACILTWSDIIFDDTIPDFVRIVQRRDGIAGATHDFTRPCFPFCALMLRRRYEYLLKLYDPATLMSMPVVSQCKAPEKRLKGKDLSGHCKRIIQSCGISEAQRERLNSSEHNGFGIRLLLQNYKHKLAHFCGLSSDTAAVAFLSGRSLRGDTTADHYRSFTSPEGQRYLYIAMSRDTRFTSFPDGHQQETRNNGQIILRPSLPNRRIGAVITVTLKKGEAITVCAPKGVQGHAQVNVLSDEHCA